LKTATTTRVERTGADLHSPDLALISSPLRLSARRHERRNDWERLDKGIVISAGEGVGAAAAQQEKHSDERSP
jgi:hypothetical protein